MQMKVDKIQGFATDMGGKTSHTTIVARAYEIPAVVGPREDHDGGQDGGHRHHRRDGGGRHRQPRPGDHSPIRAEKKALRERSRTASSSTPERRPRRSTSTGCSSGPTSSSPRRLPRPCITAPTGSGSTGRSSSTSTGTDLPTEEEHFCTYKKSSNRRESASSTIRTFDLGGDKFISDPRLAAEMNPVMGLRAIRFCLREVGSLQDPAPGHPAGQRLREDEGACSP